MSFKQKCILLKTFLELQFEVMWFYQFQTKPKFYEDICWVSVWSYLSWRVSNKSKFLSTHLLSFSLSWCNFLNFKHAISNEDICWVSVWSNVTLWVSNQSEFSWKYLLSLCLKLCMFISFKQKLILMKTFLESQFEVMEVYEFQTKVNSYADVCWLAVWSYLSLCVSAKT